MATNDPVGAFRTHSNYLRAFALLAAGDSQIGKDIFSYVFSRVRGSGILPDVNVSPTNLSQIKSSLENAWATELLLALGINLLHDDEVIRLSNHWNAVQAYYICYHATQALVVAKGSPRPESHPKTQRVFYTLFPCRPIQLEPWTLAYGNNSNQNVPGHIQIDSNIHNWASCNSSSRWSLACKALRTTREDVVDEHIKNRRELGRSKKRQEWEKEEAVRLEEGRNPRRKPMFRLPHLAQDEKQRIQNKIRSYCIIDYLYRLRLRSNYEDSTMFIDGPEYPGSSQQVRNDLYIVAATTLFVCEMHIASLIGVGCLLEWMGSWLSKDVPTKHCTGLTERISLLQKWK